MHVKRLPARESLSDVSWASLFILVSLVVSMCLATRDYVSLCLSLSDVSWASLSSLVRVCLCLYQLFLCASNVYVHARESLSDVSWASPLYQLVLYVFVYVSLYPKIS